MGIEFHLARNDHRVVEEFLATAPAGVTMISVDAHHRARQANAIEAARVAGVGVRIEPLTERLFDPGFHVGGLPYVRDRPYAAARLATSARERHRLVEDVMAVQLEVATILVPPVVYVQDDTTLGLSLQLTAEAIEDYSPEHAVRPVVLARREFLVQRPTFMPAVAHRYLDAGATVIELRLSPVGGEDDGPRKVASVLDICDHFQAAGLRVVLGHQGALGRAALALGLVDGFTVGIGMGESVNHPAVVTRQGKPREDGATSWPAAGIYVPGITTTLPRRTAAPLYEDMAIRSRLACRIGHCGSDIRGPLIDARSHYIHARTSEVAVLEGQPQAWRANGERTRVERAIELRQLINAHHLPSGTANLKTRTLRATLGHLGGGHGRMRQAG